MTLSRLFVSTRPSLVALAVALSAGMAAIAPPALAQKGEAPKVTVSKEVVGPLNEGLKAIQAKDYATAKTKLDAAIAVAKTPQDIVQVEKLRVPVAQETKDYPGLLRSLEAALATNLLTPDETKTYKYGFVSTYAAMGDNAKAMTAMRTFIDQFGGTPEQYAAVGQDLLRAKDNAGLGYVEKSLAATKAAGGKPPEAHLRLALNGYNLTAQKDKYLNTLDELIVAYPKDDYWRDYINQAQSAPGFMAAIKDVRIDIYRALLASGSKLTPEQVNAYAEETVKRGMPGEAVAVLQPMSAELSAPAKTTLTNAQEMAKADKPGLSKEEKDTLAKGTGEQMAGLGEAFMTYGDYPKAVELIQAGLTKGISDPAKADLAKLHLGIAQYRAGQKDAAQATWAGVKSDNGTAVLARAWTMISKTK